VRARIIAVSKNSGRRQRQWQEIAKPNDAIIRSEGCLPVPVEAVNGNNTVRGSRRLATIVCDKRCIIYSTVGYSPPGASSFNPKSDAPGVDMIGLEGDRKVDILGRSIKDVVGYVKW
jgi:hypothetical protein